LLTPALWGATHHRERQREGNNSHASTATDDGAFIVIFLDDSESTMKAVSTTPETPYLLPPPRAFLTPVGTPDIPLPPLVALSEREAHEEEDFSQIEVSGAVNPGRALLFGRYIGQISARVDRAWQRPRSPLSDRFECRARIVQDKDGAVREIELEQCTGDPRWQLSLVRAIQSASPLPAPPDPSIFSRTVHMQFTSEPFSPGADANGFEPEPAAR
jgi:hypothetical protein